MRGGWIAHLFLIALLFAQQALAQTPQVNNGAPAESFLGEQFCFDAEFSNSGAPGFGPYLRLVIPAELSFDGATIFSSAVNSTNVGVFPAMPGNQLTDPVINQPVTGPPGSSLWILELPVGSVVTGGPELAMEICLTIAPSAIVGSPLDVALTPVYRFGDTATGDNGPIIGTTDTAQVTPTVIRFEKENNAPEAERTPGPSWPYTYTLTVDIANTATINPIQISDALPPGLQFVGPVNIAGGAGCAVTTTPSTVTPGGTLVVDCNGNTVGTTSDNDIVVTYTAYVTDILDETNCGTTLLLNNATLDATYVPVGGPQVLPPIAADSEVTAKHVAVQKGVAPDLASPGDGVTYTLNFQVTDFGDANALVVTDILPDGLQFIAHGSLTVNGGPVAITPSVSVDAGGVTTIIYDIGAVAGTLNAGSAITLSYTAQIQQLFTATGEPVLASDALTNTVTADYDLVQGAAACSDGSGATVNIIPVAISKATQNPQPFYEPGDIVTFVLTMDIPSGDTSAISFVDALPLPVFDVSTVNTTFGVDVRLGAGDTLGLAPTSIVADVPTNTLIINWPDVNTTTPETIQVEVDVRVTDDPFADGLFLTNIFEAFTENTAGVQAQNNTPVQLLVGAPDLVITKGVAASDNPNTVINPSPATLPVDGDASNADGGDQVSFVITVENIGSAPAFDVVISDTVPAGLTACSVTTVTDGTGAPLAFSGDVFIAGLTLTNPLDGNDNNPAGGGAPFSTDTALVNFTCDVAATVQPEDVLDNQATVTWASQSGAVSFPAQTDNATVTIATPNAQKFFITSSEPGTSDGSSPPRATIGEIVRYRLVAELPEGQLNNLQLRDNLPSGLTFLDDGTARAAFVSNGAGLTSSAAAIPNITGAAADPGSVASGAVVFALPGATITGGPFGNGTDPFFNLGQVNNNDDDTDDEFLIIEFNALVNNEGAGSNDAGDNRNNSFVINNNGVGLDTSNSVQVRVAEPAVGVNKTASPTTGDAGDVINYSVVLTAAGGSDASPAHEVRVLDNLPATLINVTVTSITNVGCAAPGIVDSSAGNVIDVFVTMMEPGCAVTVNYSAELAAGVAPGTSVVNTAAANWSSLPGNGTAANPTGSTVPGAAGSGTGERDGSGGINDYVNSDNATVAIQSVVLAKTVVGSSEPSTGSAEFNPALIDLAIGETAEFLITATLPEGTVPQVILNDTLPFTNGVMAVVSASIDAVGANLTPANPAPAPVISDAQLADGVNDTVSFDFGQVVNSADGVNNAADQISIRVVGRVIDQPANSNNDTLVNAALVQFGPGLNASANASVEVVEPLLNVVKSSVSSQGDAGDTVVFTIDVSHVAASASDAHDVLLSDTLPAGLTLVGGSLVLNSGPAPDSLLEVGNGIQVLWNLFAQGQSAQVQFSATIDNTVMPSEVLTNSAALDWTSLPGADPEERAFSDSDTHGITVTAPGLVKVITATSEAATGSAQFGPETDLTIGEQATYQFSIVLPEGTTNNAVVVDQLPTGSSVLSVVSSRIVSIGANLSGASLPAVGDPGVVSDSNADTFNDRVSWTLGDLQNAPDGISDAADEILFEVVAVVLDQPLNQSGVVMQTNSATFTSATSSATGTVAADIVAPALNLTKTVTSPAGGFVDAGDTVTHQLVIEHTPASTADAYNLVVTDTLPSPGLAWINDATIVSDCPGLVADSSGAPVITFTIAQLDLPTASCTITYDVLVENSAQPAQTLANTAVMDYDSTPVFVAGETRRLMDSDSAEVTVLAPTLVKVTTMSNVADTGSSAGNPALPDLAIGETIAYEITIVVPEGTTNNAVVTDLMPANPAVGLMEVIGAAVTSVGGNLSTTLPGTPVFDDFQLVDGINDRAVFDFGSILNSPDGLNDANDRIVIEVVGRVVDVPENSAGDLLVNNATFDFNGGSLGDDADVEVVEPSLNITKNMGPVTDGVVRISIEVQNSGDAPAYDINVSDVLEDSIWNSGALMPVSVSAGFDLQTAAGPGAGQTTVTFSSDPLAVSPNGTIPAGATVSAVFDVPLAALPPTPNPVPNQADLDAADTLPGNDPAARILPPDNATAQIAIPDLAVSKTAALLLDNDGSTDVSAGDTLRYTLVVDNTGAGDATNVVLDDAPDANTSLVVGSVTSTQGTIIIGNTGGDTTVQVSIGTLAAAGSATITYDVTINNPLPSGVTQVVNQAVVDSTELPPVPSDDPIPPGVDDPTVVPVNATPDLTITKDDGGVSVNPGDTVVYTLNYQNVGTQDAIGVVVTETVPSDTVFNAAASAAGWVCAPDNNPGSTCTLTIGNLAAGGSGSAAFAVTVDNPLPAGVDDVQNTTLIFDDGSNGADPTPANNQDSDNTPVNAVPDLTLTKDDGGVTAQPGDTVAYALNYQNVGNQAATGVVISETVPANTVFNPGASTAGWACVPDNNPGSTCTLAIGGLAAGGSGAATFAVTVDNPLAAGVDMVANNAAISDDGNNGADPTPGDNSDNDNTPVTALPDLLISKDDGGITAQPGDTVAYTLSYQNVGNQNATGVVISETVPVGSSFNAAASSVGWACVPDNSAGSACTLVLGTVPGGGAGGSVTFAVTVDNPLAAGIEQINNSTVIGDDGSNGSDPTPGNNGDGDTTPVTAQPDLQVTKDDGGITAQPGDTVVYTLNYQNVGDQDATGVVLTETVPADTLFNAAASTAGWVCTPDNNPGSTCTLAIGTVPGGGAGGSAAFAVTVDNPLAAGVDEVLNTVAIADDGNNGSDPTPGDNSDSDNTPVTAVPDLVLTKDDGGAAVAPGGVVVYTLSYQNVGNQAATTVQIDETVPANTTFNAGSSSAGWVCVPDGNAGAACTFDLGTVAGGASGTVDFAVTVDDPLPAGVTEVLNSATIVDDGDNGPDPTPGDNGDSDNTPVGAFPDLTLVKTDGDISVEPGGVVVYDLTYGNVGDQDATGVVITETVPANTVFVAASSTAGWTCVPDGNAGSACTLALGNVNVGDTGTVQFAVVVDAPLAGGITEIINTANIADDGSNGPDINPLDNDTSDNTPVRLNPPVGLKLGESNANGLITWTMWWFNNGNQSDLPTLILDAIPAGTQYVAGSLNCVADGTSQCVNSTFNSVANRIEVETVIAPDFNAPGDSMPDALNNEVIITFQTQALSSGIFLNQAEANWDGGNDGSPVDDQNGGQLPVMTDDPVTNDFGDPTAVGLALEIPTLNRWGLLLMLLLMGLSVKPYLKRYRQR